MIVRMSLSPIRRQNRLAIRGTQTLWLRRSGTVGAVGSCGGEAGAAGGLAPVLSSRAAAATADRADERAPVRAESCSSISDIRQARKSRRSGSGWPALGIHGLKVVQACAVSDEGFIRGRPAYLRELAKFPLLRNVCQVIPPPDRNEPAYGVSSA